MKSTSRQFKITQCNRVCTRFNRKSWNVSIQHSKTSENTHLVFLRFSVQKTKVENFLNSTVNDNIICTHKKKNSALYVSFTQLPEVTQLMNGFNDKWQEICSMSSNFLNPQLDSYNIIRKLRFNEKRRLFSRSVLMHLDKKNKLLSRRSLIHSQNV